MVEEKRRVGDPINRLAAFKGILSVDDVKIKTNSGSQACRGKLGGSCLT